MKLANKQKNYQYLSLIIITIFSLTGILLYFGNKKFGFHMDEILTYGLSNSYYEPFPFNYFNNWIDSNKVNSYLSASPNQLFSFKSVTYNQMKDVHPPIYYLLFHSISSFFPNVFSKWIGISFNILVFILIYISILYLIYYISEDKWFSYITATFWGMSIGTISSIMYIRMYTLFTLWLILFLFSILKIHLKKQPTYFDYVHIFSLTIAGVLTHYYFLIIVFFISILLCLFLLFKKKLKTFVFLSLQ